MTITVSEGGIGVGKFAEWEIAKGGAGGSNRFGNKITNSLYSFDLALGFAKQLSRGRGHFGRFVRTVNHRIIQLFQISLQVSGEITDARKINPLRRQLRFRGHGFNLRSFPIELLAAAGAVGFLINSTRIAADQFRHFEAGWGSQAHAFVLEVIGHLKSLETG